MEYLWAVSKVIHYRFRFMVCSQYSHLAWCTAAKPLLCSWRERVNPDAANTGGRWGWDSILCGRVWLSLLHSCALPSGPCWILLVWPGMNLTKQWGLLGQESAKRKVKKKQGEKTTDIRGQQNNKENIEQPTSIFTIRERILTCVDLWFDAFYLLSSYYPWIWRWAEWTCTFMQKFAL